MRLCEAGDSLYDFCMNLAIGLLSAETIDALAPACPLAENQCYFDSDMGNAYLLWRFSLPPTNDLEKIQNFFFANT